MSFLPPVPVDLISGHNGHGGISVNFDGSLLASVFWEAHCVHIYSLVDPSAYPVVITRVGDYPYYACFVHRSGRDTLLISYAVDKVVEVTVTGNLLRTIALPEGSRPCGIAYCDKTDIIAVSLFSDHTVVLLQYESGIVKSEVTIGSHCFYAGNSRLKNPHAVSFITDGDCILVADTGNHRVSKFSATSGEFIAYVATKAANGIEFPTDVLQCEDGSILVLTLGNFEKDASVVHVGADGVTLGIISRETIVPRSLAYSPLLNGVFVKSYDGSVFILRDAWSHSSRCAWVHACVG